MSRNKNNFIASTVAMLIVWLVSYAFLCICNWSFYPGDWNGLSRFLLGIGTVLGVTMYWR